MYNTLYIKALDKLLLHRVTGQLTRKSIADVIYFHYFAFYLFTFNVSCIITFTTQVKYYLFCCGAVVLKLYKNRPTVLHVDF